MSQSVLQLNIAQLRTAVSVYGAFLRTAFLTMLAYRLRYVTGIITYLLFVTVHYFIWQGIYSTKPDALIHGFTLGQMVTYVAVGWIARSLYFSNIDVEVNEYVRSGEVSAYLIRPVNFHHMMVARAAGETLFRLLFFTVPISVVIVAVYPVSLPFSLVHGLAFLLATVFSFLITAELNFLVGLLSFSLKSIDGVMRAKYFLLQLLSGLLLPISFFPYWMQEVLQWLPFQAIAFIPLQIYLGQFQGGALLSNLLIQFVWWIALSYCSLLGWKRAVRHLTLQGG